MDGGIEIDRATDEAIKAKKTQEVPDIQKENFQTRRNEGRLLAVSLHTFSFESFLERLRVLRVCSLSLLFPPFRR